MCHFPSNFVKISCVVFLHNPANEQTNADENIIRLAEINETTGTSECVLSLSCQQFADKCLLTVTVDVGSLADRSDTRQPRLQLSVPSKTHQNELRILYCIPRNGRKLSFNHKHTSIH